MTVRTKLSVRTQPQGGSVAPRVNSSKHLTGDTRLTILVHGYNNTEDAAAESFRHFRRNTQHRAFDQAIGELCEFYWPGDINAWSGISALSYSFQVARARESAQRLRDYLASIAGDRTLDIAFICHSLGNRLILELIDACAARGPRLRVHMMCLMAAAVPLEMIDRGGRLNIAARRIEKTSVLFSEADLALGIAFNVGQSLAGEPCSGAVGKTGGPALARWSSTVNMTPYDHGDYWRKVESAFEVQRAFGVGEYRYRPQRVTLTRRLQEFIGVPRRVPPARPLLGDWD